MSLRKFYRYLRNLTILPEYKKMVIQSKVDYPELWRDMESKTFRHRKAA